MKNTSRAGLLLALLVAITTPMAAHADGTERARPALWTIGDADTTISLFGTVHVLRPEVDWFHGEVREAFDEADDVVLEMLSPEPAEEQALVMRYGIDDSGRSLRSRLGDDERARYERAVSSLGFPVDAFDPFRPWMAAVTLSVMPMMQAGYSVELGVDEVLSVEAEREGKRTVGLETPEQQLEFFDAMDEELQLDMLNGTVLELDGIRTDVREMVALWSGGRVEALGAMVTEMMTGYGDDGRITDVLLTGRNRAWADWVDDRMARPGRVFLAVGAAHLTGDGNLLELLEARGYEIERVR